MHRQLRLLPEQLRNRPCIAILLLKNSQVEKYFFPGFVYIDPSACFGINASCLNSKEISNWLTPQQFCLLFQVHRWYPPELVNTGSKSCYLIFQRTEIKGSRPVNFGLEMFKHVSVSSRPVLTLNLYSVDIVPPGIPFDGVCCTLKNKSVYIVVVLVNLSLDLILQEAKAQSNIIFIAGFPFQGQRFLSVRSARVGTSPYKPAP